MTKAREDSHFWRVDRALGDLLVKVAVGHAEAGGEVGLRHARGVA